MNASSPQNEGESLTGILEGLTAGLETEQITIGHIVEQFKYRGFGPLLLVPALIVILPTGAIPLIPALAGLIIAFVCLQMLIGREHPWLPKRLKEFSIPKSKLENSIRRAKPYTEKIDKILHRRFVFFVNAISKRLTALFCLVLCLVMFFIGFIPMLPATLALPVFFFGLGFIAQDGLIITLGFLSMFVSAVGLWFLIA